MKEHNFSVVISGDRDTILRNTSGRIAWIDRASDDVLMDFRKQASTFEEAVLDVSSELRKVGARIEQVWR